MAIHAIVTFEIYNIYIIQLSASQAMSYICYNSYICKGIMLIYVRSFLCARFQPAYRQQQAAERQTGDVLALVIHFLVLL